VTDSSNFSMRNEYVPDNDLEYNYLLQIRIGGVDHLDDEAFLNSQIYSFLNEISADFERRSSFEENK
jgi:hypothetical protein